ncbi:M50 family metallopeptidase [Hoyosella altamirensis]|uniref:Zinc metalloprotease Rip1 n=1 Tax=Hoyosella altamirensis TaxID=616997 RepID=A0A839RRV1_9ACTN|nr:site-2 protease family protein [Hoyosella altamirensis]MBB3038601.1 membrane-associated protease RseP (regulator of RpoE activity) [Hoyosella altamirensis]
MMFTLGVILFALGIGISIAIHEYGHLAMAKAFGMKVRRYYIGFGPKIFAFKRGETEYGLKAIPAGGFCDIAGMTALDELEPDEHDRAMYKQATWKRLLVMLGGPISHAIIGLTLVFILALGWGLPKLAFNDAVVGETTCVAPTQAPPEQDNGRWVAGELAPCGGGGPAEAAGIEPGDLIVAVNGDRMRNFGEVVQRVQATDGTAVLTVERDGETREIPVAVQPVERYVIGSAGAEPELATVGAIGVAQDLETRAEASEIRQYGPLGAVPATFVFTGELTVQTWEALLRFPERLPAVARSIMGEDRDPDTPISVVGASRLGGEVVDMGLWQVFILLLAVLNLFVGLFNLLPLLPLDGGHMAVTIYEAIRNRLRRLMGKPNGPPVDYTKLMPITFVVMVIGAGIMLLTITADIVNPITFR